MGNIRQNVALCNQKLIPTDKGYEADDESEIETNQKKKKGKTKKNPQGNRRSFLENYDESEVNNNQLKYKVLKKCFYFGDEIKEVYLFTGK